MVASVNKQKVYLYIVQYFKAHGYAPTTREIAKGVGLKSTSSVFTYLERLKEDGLIETDAEFGSPRAFRLTGYAFEKETQSEK